VIWWIVGGVVLLGFVVLAVTVFAVLDRLHPLAEALRRLARRSEQAQGLQEKLLAVQERAQLLQAALEPFDEARGGRGDSTTNRTRGVGGSHPHVG